MSLVEFRACLIVLVATFVVNAVAAEDAVDSIDEELLAQLQGEWDPVSSIFNGKENGIGREQRPSFVIDGRYMSIRFQDKVVGKFEIKHLVTKESHGHIDYLMLEPRRETTRVKQLFKLRDDKLTTCVFSPPGENRPSELVSTVGSKILMTVSERREKK